MLFRSSQSDLLGNRATEVPAIVTRVWSDTCVNLTVFRDNVAPLMVSSVSYDDGPERPAWCGWRWMPYQKAVAAGEIKPTLHATPVSPQGRPPYKDPVCRGSWALGSACGHCERCEDTRPMLHATPKWGSLEVSDAEAAAVAVAPRITLEGMNNRIAREHYFNAEAAIAALGHPHGGAGDPLSVLTLCILVLDNGWTLVGKSAPASVENYDEALGRKLAKEDCIRQLWPLEGYRLRNELAGASAKTPAA